MRKSLGGWRRLRPGYWLKRGVIAILGLWVLGIAAFAFLPVPFSAVMVERQVSAWLSGDFGYVAHSDWVSMDDISPQMALAVMAAEDQKFPDHWGFDVAAIEKALSHNEAPDAHPRRVHAVAANRQEPVSVGWPQLAAQRAGGRIDVGHRAGVDQAAHSDGVPEHRRVRRRGVWRRGGITTLFHKPAKRLTAAEAALLAAVLPNPHRFRADAPSGYVIQRQQWIMRQMRQLGGKRF